MISKFTNDEFYIMYRKYKQKYLNLKYGILKGGDNVNHIIIKLESIVAAQYNSSVLTDAINKYNMEVDKSPLLNNFYRNNYKYNYKIYNQNEINNLRVKLQQAATYYYNNR